MKKLIKKIFRRLLFQSKYSKYTYSIPVKLDKPRIWQRSPAHIGKYKNAVDILVPPPWIQQTIVYAPASGRIEYLELSNDKWGATVEYKNFLNFINIRVDQNEFYELSHVAALPNQSSLRIGQEVKSGQPLAIAALNGWMTTTNGIPDTHIHMMVGKWLHDSNDFYSLEIRWKK